MTLTVVARALPSDATGRGTSAGRDPTAVPERVGGARDDLWASGDDPATARHRLRACALATGYLTECELLTDNIGVDFTSEELRVRVDPIVEVVRSGLEDGLAFVDPIQQLVDVSSDPWFDAHVVRRVARARIERAYGASGRPLWCIDDKVPNSGIHLLLPGTRVRVARGSVSRVPAPGRNYARREFWSQSRATYVQNVLPLYPDVLIPGAGELNLLLLWTTSDASSVSMSVAVPRGEWPYGRTPRLHAHVPLDDLGFDGEFVGDHDEGDDLVAQIDEGEASEDDGR